MQRYSIFNKLTDSFEFKYIFGHFIKIFIFNIMDQLVGPSTPSYKVISGLSSDFNMSGCDCFSWKKIWDLSSLPESLNFEDTVYAGCANGSIIAVHCPTYAKNCRTNSITVHDMKYNLLYRYVINIECDKIFFYVTSSDHLIVLTNRGILITYFSGYEKSQFNLFHSNDADRMIETDEIIAADFWDNGFVFMTKKKLYYSPNYSQPVLFGTLSENIHFVRDFKVIPSEFTENNQPIIFFTAFSSILNIATSENIMNIDFENEILSFSFSQDYSMIAFMCEQNILIITNAMLDKTLLQVAIQDLMNFTQISWIGNIAPVIAFQDEIAIIGRIEKNDTNNDNYPIYGDLITIDQLTYSFSGRIRLFQSTNSAFVLSNLSLFKISYVSEDLRCASGNVPIYPAARLIDSFDKRSSTQIIRLRDDEEKLSEAVRSCIAISKELDFPEEQKLALFAAAYGRSYIPSSSPFYEELVSETAEFEQITRYLRICSTFNREMNMLVTYNELANLSLHDILMRFCNRRLFSLAVDIADYFCVDKVDIMTEWCCSMASTIFDDENALKIIEKKKNSSFNANSIALALFKCGRPNLAKLVAEKVEDKPERVVPFYVKFGLWEKAFEAAARSYNTSLFIELLNKALSNANNAKEKFTSRNEFSCSYELITNAISKDEVAAKTVSKLSDSNKKDTKLAILLQNTPRTSHTVEIEIVRLLRDFNLTVEMKTMSNTGLFERFLIMKRTVKQMINKYGVNWVSTVYMTLKQNLHVFRVEDELSSVNGEGRKYLFSSFNSIFDRMVEVGDFTTAMKLVKDTNSNEKRYTVRLARVLVDKRNYYRFKELADVTYKDCWLHFILILFYSKGMEEAVKFAKEIKLPKKSAEYVSLLAQNDFPECVFTSKLSLKVLSDKFIFV